MREWVRVCVGACVLMWVRVSVESTCVGACEWVGVGCMCGCVWGGGVRFWVSVCLGVCVGACVVESVCGSVCGYE